jgi:hypothetical protein
MGWAAQRAEISGCDETYTLCDEIATVAQLRTLRLCGAVARGTPKRKISPGHER